MFRFPRTAETLIESLRIAFTRPTVKRCATLLVGAILAQGRRTIAEVQRAARDLMPGHFCVQGWKPEPQPGRAVRSAALLQRLHIVLRR